MELFNKYYNYCLSINITEFTINSLLIEYNSSVILKLSAELNSL